MADAERNSALLGGLGPERESLAAARLVHLSIDDARDISSIRISYHHCGKSGDEANRHDAKGAKGAKEPGE
ncbi:hypothetical protein WME79_15915 [Sorangium sp. So ce726]|uniref:hypothetical protein n=1 Tax=Sorangium sp. So ce726 TaxID=3133319 RepID=UPI003F60A918